MALTVLNKQFLAVLRELRIDIDQFPDKSFDGLFEKGCNDSKHFLDWFCENFSSDNVLTEEERSAYNELENSKQFISDYGLENNYDMCYPLYDDLKPLDSNEINALTEELENLNKECKQLQLAKSSLKLDRNKLKKVHNSLMEENHKWKKRLSDERQNCMILNADMNNFLKDVHYFLLKKPESTIDFSLLNNCTEFENIIHNLFSNQYVEVTSKCLQQDNSISDVYYTQLDDNLSIAEYCRIVSSGRLEEKKIILFKLEEAFKKKDASSVKNMSNISYIFKEANGSESLDADVLFIENEELFMKTRKLSHLELCKVTSQRQLNKLYTVNSLIHKASYYKELLTFDLAISGILSHILNRSVQNTGNIYKLMAAFSNDLNESQMNNSSKYEFLDWRKKRFSEVARALKEKHPFVTALKKLLPDICDTNKEVSIPSITCSMKLFVESSAVFPEIFFRALEQQIRKQTPKLLCGPTNQLQFTLIEIQKKYQEIERLLIQRKQEIRKLANKYVSFKDGVTQANRERLLLWTLFLTNPAKLESTVKKIEEESLGYEQKYSRIEE